MPDFLFIALRVLAGLGGAMLVVITLSAAIRSFVLPRNEAVRLNGWVFMGIRVVFDLAAKSAKSYERRDQILAHYAPVALVALPVAWEGLVSLGYTGMYWAVGEGDLIHCYQLSGSSLLTLGTIDEFSFVGGVLTYSEALLGLLLLTLLLSYLPTIYQAFARRETTVALLELRAGTPPTAAGLLTWLHPDGSGQNDEQWAAWEQWFVEIEESHTSLPVLSFFRSPQPGRSWVMAGGMILDAAALLFAVVDVPRPRPAENAFKAGCLALNRVYRYFDRKAGAEPTGLLPAEGDKPLHRADFDEACRLLADKGLHLREDRAAAWTQYQELRHRYLPALEFLGRITMAPARQTAV